MCTNYVASTRQEIAALRLGVLELPHEDWPDEIYPGYAAPILLRAEGGGVHCRLARFGLLPRWCKNAAQAHDIGRKTYSARSETASEKPSYRAPWHERQWVLAPMRHFFEPCWEDAPGHAGRSVRWQIGLADASPLAVAGLWERWTNPEDGAQQDSFTLLTVNADGHAVMGRMHKPGEEKRMPVIIPEPHYAAWLHSTAQDAAQWMRPWPAGSMRPQAAPRARPVAKATVPPQAQRQGQNLSLF
jgi:putative SOS response-associated peptidase YedK